MRILLCTPYSMSPQFTQGGITVWAHNMMEYYQNNAGDIQIDIVPFDRKRTKKGLLRRIFGGLLDYRKAIKEAKRKLNKEKYDVLHICTSASISLFKDLIVLKAARKRNVKTVIHLHFGRVPELSQKNNWEWKVLRSAFSQSNTIITIDLLSYNYLRNRGLQNVHYLPNPLSEKIIRQVETSGNIQRLDNKICFVGHVIPSKGVFELAKAIRELKGVKLYVIGKVTEDVKTRMIELAGGYELIVFVGEIPHEEVINQLLSSSIFVLPSYTEGFPNVILESMACGCAIVSTTVGAIPEMLNLDSDEPCGLCSEPKDVDGLRRNIQYYLDHPTNVRKYSEIAIKRVNDMYAVPRVWEQLVGIWKKGE